MDDYDGIDFFRGRELVVDPYPYFDALRARCPV
jgi:cytochrome P450 family 150 subfamily A5